VPLGATAPTYQLTAADVGHQISAQVRLAKGNYLGKVQVVPVGLVRTTPTVTVKAAGRVRKAVVSVRVSAPGAGRPPGEVIIRIGKVKTTARLKDGRVRVVVPNLEPGKRLVTVRFTGTTVVEPGRGSDTVQIKR